MKKILLATDSYHFAPTANGICVEEIAQELLKRGNEIHVLCFKHEKESENEMIEGISVHRIKMDWVNRLRFAYEKKLQGKKQKIVRQIMIALNRLEAVVFLHWYPLRSPLFCYRYTKQMEKLQKLYHYDIIISSYSPFEAAYALYKMNQKYKVKKCLYTLDSFTNYNKKRFFLSPQYQDKKGWEWEKKIYEKCDLVLNLKCHEKHHEKERYQIFADKMKIVDIPHMIQYERKNSHHQSKKIQMLYAGNFYKDIADDIFKILHSFINQDRIELSIYGKNTPTQLQAYCNKEIIEKINFGGFVDRDVILEEESKADVLLSLGCPETDNISSKIFEYMSFGGKVLHIFKGKNDPNVVYFEKYNNACCINCDDDFDKYVEKIKNFLDKRVDIIPYEKIQEIFKENMPDYTAKILLGGGYDLRSLQPQKSRYTILYAGVIRQNIMPHVIDLLEPFLSKGVLCFDIYGRSSDEYAKHHLSETAYQNVIFHGFVKRDKVLAKEYEADILLSMGNPDTDFIPSKIFEYLATGRKILHLYDYDHDSALPYYSIYPNSCCINVKDDMSDNREKVEKFIKSDVKNIDFDSLKQMYYMNTPEFTAEMILSI